MDPVINAAATRLLSEKPWCSYLQGSRRLMASSEEPVFRGMRRSMLIPFILRTQLATQLSLGRALAPKDNARGLCNQDSMGP